MAEYKITWVKATASSKTSLFYVGVSTFQEVLGLQCERQFMLGFKDNPVDICVKGENLASELIPFLK
jgi:hypothetical protein